jgi:23S rRNA-/tRNA-specific pseudouridylate synthase
VCEVFDSEIMPGENSSSGGGDGKIELELLRRKNLKRGRFTDDLLKGAAAFAATVEDGDTLVYTAHVHEPPVLFDPAGGPATTTTAAAGVATASSFTPKQTLEILHDDADCLVLNKPAGVPVHPTGKYNRNSLVSILAHDYGYTFVNDEDKKNGATKGNTNGSSTSGTSYGGGMLSPTHRLDRVTSGVLILAKTRAYARRIQAELEHREGVAKEYLALVRISPHTPTAAPAAEATPTTTPLGPLVPGQTLTCSVPLFETQFTAGFGRFAARLGADLIPSASLAPLSATTAPRNKKSQVRSVSGGPKPAETRVRVLRVSGAHALVSCTPITGRTHQIRKHLALLGIPIANDPVYGDAIIGSLFIQLSEQVNALHIKALENLKSDRSNSTTTNNAKDHSNDDAPQVKIDYVEKVRDLFTEIEHAMRIKAIKLANSSNNNNTKIDNDLNNEICHECGADLSRYRDPAPADLFIYLHALKYSGPSFNYQTSVPAWARPYID